MGMAHKISASMKVMIVFITFRFVSMEADTSQILLVRCIEDIVRETPDTNTILIVISDQWSGMVDIGGVSSGSMCNGSVATESASGMLKNLCGNGHDTIFIMNTKWTNQVENEEWPYLKKASMVVLLLGPRDVREEMRVALNASRRHPAWSYQSRCVVAVGGASEEPSWLTTKTDVRTRVDTRPNEVFQVLWEKKLSRAVVLTQSFSKESTVVISSWFPYQSSTNCGASVKDVVVLEHWMLCNEERFLYHAHLFSFEALNNLQGCTLTVSTRPWDPYVIASDSDSKDVKHAGEKTIHYEKGLEISILRAIAERSNFSIKYKPPVETIGDILNALVSGVADVAFVSLSLSNNLIVMFDPTISYNRESVDWFVPSETPLPQWMSLVLVFEPTLWAWVMISYVSMSLVLWFVANNRQQLQLYKNSNRDENLYNEISLDFMHALSVLLGESVPSLPYRPSLRLAFIVWVLCCLVINQAYQSGLIYVLTRNIYLPSIQSLEELIESGIRIGLPSGFVDPIKAIDDLQYNTILSLSEICDDPEICLQRTAFEKDMAYPTTRSHVEYETPRKYFSHGNNLIDRIEGPIWSYDTVMYVQKGSVILGRFNSVIRRLFETGLIDKWWDDLTSIPAGKSEVHGEEEERLVLTTSHLQGAFILMIIGMMFGFVVFVFEITIYRYRRWKSNPDITTKVIPFCE